MKNQIVLLGLLALCTHSQMSAASPQKSIYHKGWIDFNKNGVMDIYEDPKAPLEDRVQDLLSQMTLDEKTCQMATLYGSGRILKDALPQENWKTEIWKDGIGNIDEEHNGLGKFRSEYAFPYTRHVDTKHAIQRWFIEETRLGIPVDFTNEGIRGLCHDRATYFPAQCGQFVMHLLICNMVIFNFKRVDSLSVIIFIIKIKVFVKMWELFLNQYCTNL